MVKTGFLKSMQCRRGTAYDDAENIKHIILNLSESLWEMEKLSGTNNFKENCKL
jgi:hypothetical protein